MDMNISERLVAIMSLGLAVAALIFIGLSIYKGIGNNIYLQIGLGCCVLSNIFNVIRIHMKKSGKID